MTTDSGALWNLFRLKQLDQMWPRDVEEVRRLLGSQGLIVLNDTDVFAGEEQLCRPLESVGKRIHQVVHGLGWHFAGDCPTHGGDEGAYGFLACDA